MEPPRIGPSNCLPKTQVCAKSKDEDVYKRQGLQSAVAEGQTLVEYLPELIKVAAGAEGHINVFRRVVHIFVHTWGFAVIQHPMFHSQKP